MDKDAQLERIDSNARPYAIFFGYLGCCLAVSVFIVMKMFERAEALYTSAPSQLPAKRHVIVFTTLAACSLLSTWGYMFQYFQWSYDNWLAVRSQHDLDPSVRHWGLWLKETSLFKEAWLSVVIGHNRYWWSHQIFYFAACLGLHLEWKGVRRGINYTWAFMLLGQIVAISFATNMFFLTLLLSPPQHQPERITAKASTSKPPPSKTPDPAPISSPRKWFGPWLIDALAVLQAQSAATCLSLDKYQNGAPGALQILLLPHVALLILPTARAILPARFLPLGDAKFVDKFYTYLWLWNFTAVAGLAWMTYTAYTAGSLGDIRNALFDHPAVSSVGFDTIFCWLSWICWWQIQGDKTSYVKADL